MDSSNLSGRKPLGFPGKVAAPIPVGNLEHMPQIKDNKQKPIPVGNLEHMPQIKDNKQKAMRQLKMVEGFRKSKGKVAPRNRHAFKLAAMKRKSTSGKPPAGNYGTIG